MNVEKTVEKSNKKAQKQSDFKKGGILQPFVKFFLKHDISPNTLTFLGMACSICTAVLLAFGFLHQFWLWSFPVTAIVLSGFFDLVDGEVARQREVASDSGAFLDSTFDRISDAVVIMGMAFAGFIEFPLAYAIMFMIIMISYTRSRAETLGVNMKGVGRMERPDRVTFLIFALTGEFIMFYFVGISVIFACMVLFTILIAYTLIQRVIYAYKVLNKKSDQVQ